MSVFGAPSIIERTNSAARATRLSGIILPQAVNPNLALARRLLGSRLLDRYLSHPKVKPAAELRKWPENIEAVITKAPIDGIIAEVEKMEPAEVIAQAEAVVRELYDRLKLENKEPVPANLAEFFARETHGEFDVGQILTDTFGSAAMVLSNPAYIGRSPNLLAKIKQGLILLRAAQVYIEDAPTAKVDAYKSVPLPFMQVDLQSLPESDDIRFPVFPVGHMVEGRFRLERILGAGGMAAVFLASDIRDGGREVALKAGSRATAKYLIAEAQASARRAHPNLAAYVGAGEEGGWYYLVTEYIPGKTVEALLEEKGHFSVPEALDIITQICYGLAAAGDIHADLKPANVIIDENGKARVIDYGLGEAIRRGLVAEGMVMGTAAYISPEQALGEKIDCRADIYSLGIVLFEMLAGSLPFQGKTISAVMLQHIKETLPEIEDLDSRTAGILKRMAMKDRRDRYPNFAILITDLQIARRRLLKRMGSPERNNPLSPSLRYT